MAKKVILILLFFYPFALWAQELTNKSENGLKRVYTVSGTLTIKIPGENEEDIDAIAFQEEFVFYEDGFFSDEKGWGDGRWYYKNNGNNGEFMIEYDKNEVAERLRKKGTLCDVNFLKVNGRTKKLNIDKSQVGSYIHGNILCHLNIHYLGKSYPVVLSGQFVGY